MSEEIKPLELSELKKIYHTNMRKDFPPTELRPWGRVEKAWQDGRYPSYAFYSDGTLQAYACFYCGHSSPCVIMDYLAVVSGLRGKGIGSTLLSRLLPCLTDWEGVFVEAESVSSAKNDSEKEIREKRLYFYLKNGAIMTGVNCLLFKVDYSLLYLPTSEISLPAEGFYDAVCRLYKDLYPPLFGGALCKPYPADTQSDF